MPPVSVLVKPSSSACNLNCEYCFYRDEAENRSSAFLGFMTKETAEQLITRAYEYADGYCSFMFQGGEPTLSGLDFFKFFVETEKRLNTRKIKVFNSIQTNGIIIDDEWAKFFKDENFLVGLSLDGNAEIHNLNRVDSKNNGTFNRVMKTVNIFDKYKVEYNILSVLTGKNARSCEKIYNFFKKHNFKYIQFIPCLEMLGTEEKSFFSLSPEEYKYFLVNVFRLWYDDLKCGNYVSIRHIDNMMNIVLGNKPEICSLQGHCSVQFVTEGDGTVYPCDFYVLDEWKLGDVFENSFSQLVSCENAKRFVESSLDIPKKCRECECYGICRNGCRRERKYVDEKTNLNIFCESYKGFFSECKNEILESARIISRLNG